MVKYVVFLLVVEEYVGCFTMVKFSLST
jgi:hypothetical protein